MNELELKDLNLSELKSYDLQQTNGGWIVALLGLVGLYLVTETAANPKASWDAFKEGWDAAGK